MSENNKPVIIGEKNMIRDMIDDATRGESSLSTSACYVKMPTALTSGNGAKYLMIGEFFVELEDPDHCTCGECDYCEDFGEAAGTIKVPIPWTTIKEIYAKAVENLSIT